ncbi:hypothetical protein D6817_00445, partial [Candidatus Pacearchaeota archaeon]
MKKLAILFILVPSLSYAKVYTSKIPYPVIDWNTKREIISQSFFHKSYHKLSSSQRTGINFAVRNSVIIFDPDCDSHLLKWDSRHIYWGIKYSKTRRKKRTSKP